MKIAQIAPHFSPYSEKRLVGIKRIIYILFTELSKRGHDVSIIATSDSDMTNGKVIPTIPSLRSYKIPVYDPKSFYYGVAHASKAARIAKKFDIVHNHAEQVFLPFIPFIKKPIISTIHGTVFNEEEKFIFKQFQDQFTAIGISKHSIKITNYITYSKQIYNGVDTQSFLYNETPKDYMFFMARINPDKGALEAIKIASIVKQKLLIQGYKELSKENYYKRVLITAANTPFAEVNKNEVFDLDTKLKLYQNAKLFLFPVMQEETFASTVIEAMACGTPVIAFAKGSLPEQVVDGETGFIVNPSDDDIRGNWIIKKTGIEGLCEAVERIYSMPEDQYRQMRRNCRAHVEKNFTVERMVDEYEKVYKEILLKYKL